jgi:copper(I)-binding protein
MSRRAFLASSITLGAITLAAASALAHVTLEVREARAGTSYKAVLKVPHGCDGASTLKVRAQILARDLKPGPLYIPVTQECEKGEARWADIPAPGQDAHALKAPAPALTILAQHSQQGGHAAMAGDTKVYKAGSLTIEAPWARATPGGAKVAGGFIKITNTGKEPDRLIGGSVPFANRFEVHEMAVEGGIMKMRELAKGLEIKPGETVELKPGSYHVMFMDLKSGLKEGETVKGTLVFEKAGKVDVEYKVGPIGGGMPKGGGHTNH